MLVSALALLPAVLAAALTWTPTASLPDGYSGHALVASGGYLYNAGGLSSTNGVLDGQNVFVAAMQPSGAVNGWSKTTALPEAVFYHAGAAANGYVYLLGGYHYVGSLVVSNVVYVAKQNADGSLGGWTATSPLPQSLFFLSATVWNGRVYVAGGWNGTDVSSAVYSAALQSDGSLSPWRGERPLPEGVYTHAEVSDGTLYVLGGAINGGTQISNSVWAAPINRDGTLGTWASTTPLPQPLSNHGAVVSGRVYVLGGWNGSTPMADVVSAPSSPSGLGSWSPEASMPRALYLHGVAIGGGRLYVSGGADPNATQAGVYWTALPPPPPPADTTPPVTTLTIGAPSFGVFVAPSTLFSLSAADAGSGVAATYWSVDGGSFAAYAGPFTLPAGAHWLGYYSVDNAGNAETVRVASAAVDGAAPVSTLAVGAPQATLASGQLVVSSVTLLSAQAGDPAAAGVASGVRALSVSVDGVQVVSSAAFALPAAEGAHTVSLLAVDNVGNAEAAHAATVYLDRTPPVTSLTPTTTPYAAADGGAPWLGAAAQLAWSADDPSSGGTAAGVHHSEYSIDGAAVAQATAALVLPEGAHAVAFRSVDNVGNAEAWKTVSYRIDATAPQTALTVPSPLTPDAPLTLAAQDAGSGVARTLYAVDGAADVLYAGPFRLALGSHTVTFGSVDNAGNAEPRQSVTLFVAPADTTPPVTTLTVGAPRFQGFVSTSTSFSLSAADAGSGVQSTLYSIDDGSFTAYAAPFTLAAGARWVRYYSVDFAGNVEAVQASSSAVDAGAPVSVLSVGAPQAVLADGRLVVSSSTQLSAQASDPAVAGVASGVASLSVRVDGADVSSSAPFTLPAVDGPHAVTLRAVDAVGNAEAAHAQTIYVDRTPPVSALTPSVAPYVAADGGAPWLGAAAALSWSAQDPSAGGVSAGVNRTEYSLDGAAVAQATVTLVLPEGAHTVVFRSVDDVGNAEAWQSASYRVDATAPRTTLTVGSPVLQLFGQELATPDTPLSLTATDAGSGVASTAYSVDGAADQPYSAPFHLAAGAHTVSFGSVDHAGNVETRQSVTVQVGTLLADAVAAADTITLAGNASIQGDARAPQVSVGHNASVSGTIYRSAPVESADLAAALAYAQTHNAGPGGALALGGSQSKTLPAGVYVFSSLTIAGNASLAVSGAAQIFLTGPLIVSGNATLNSSGSADDLWIFSDASQVSVSGNGRAAFHLYAPKAAVAFSGNGQIAGRIYGQTVSLTGNSVVPSNAALAPVAHKRDHDDKPSRPDQVPETVFDARSVASVVLDQHAPAAAGPDRAQAEAAPAKRREDLPPPAASSSAGGRTFAAAPAHPARALARPLEASSAAAAADLSLRAPAPAAPSSPVAALAGLPSWPGRPGRRLARSKPFSLPVAPRAAFGLVTSDGATVRASSGPAVTVPQGAVASGLAVTLNVAASADPVVERAKQEARDKRGLTACGDAVQFGPEGTRFAKPVTIELPFDASKLPVGAPLTSLVVEYWNPQAQDWEAMPSLVDPQAGVVRAQTSHFSLYQVNASASAPASSPVASAPLAFGPVYAYPNPSRAGARTVIHADVTGADSIDVALYDMAGERRQAGSASVVSGAADYAVDLSGLGSGVYFYVVKAGPNNGGIRFKGRLAVVK